jgi:hypothetical protein
VSAIGAEHHDHNEGTLWRMPPQLFRHQNQQEMKKDGIGNKKMGDWNKFLSVRIKRLA